MTLKLISLLINSATACFIFGFRGGLVISVMHNPVILADYRGEYIEMFITTGDEIDINGLVVSSNGDSGFTVGQSINIPMVVTWSSLQMPTQY